MKERAIEELWERYAASLNDVGSRIRSIEANISLAQSNIENKGAAPHENNNITAQDPEENKNSHPEP